MACKNGISIAGITAILLISCNQNYQELNDGQSIADSTTASITSSIAAVENGKDSERRFIRTAELKFKVKSVVESTYHIEDIINNNGGFVTYTELKSEIDNTTSVAISADSSLETTYYTVTNAITLRVPNTALDTTLKAIAREIDYLDYRIIKADDVALQILSNNLAQKRAEKNEERLAKAIDNRGKKLNETTLAEEELLHKQQKADEAKIANLSLTDQVKFSTVNLLLYQRQAIKRAVISNNKNIDAYEPGLGTKMLESLVFGWKILESFIVFIAKFWGLFVLAIITLFLFRRYKHKTAKEAKQSAS
jgi:hypothetical protein